MWSYFFTNSFRHSSGSGFGENLYAAGPIPGTAIGKGKDAVGAWYNEIKQYNFASPGFGMNTG